MNIEEILATITQYVSIEQMIYITVAIIILLIIIIVMGSLRKKKAKRILAEAENRYHVLKNIPLAFKVSKAQALAKVNPNMVESVDDNSNRYDKYSDELKKVSVELATIDDLIYSHKVKNALKRLKALDENLSELEANIKNLNDNLDTILEREKEQRVSINELKDLFREVKEEIAINQNAISSSMEYIEQCISNIEQKFSTFEDYMFASEFNKASKQQLEIRNDIEKLQLLVEVLPGLYDKIKITLPKLLDEIGYEYSQCKSKGINLDHLKVPQNSEFISERIKGFLNSLRNGVVDNIDDDLNDCEKRIVQLQKQIASENQAFDEVNNNIEKLFEDIDNVNRDMDAIEQLYNRVYERFGFENWANRLEDSKIKLGKLNDLKRKLEKIIQDNNLPYTQIIVAYKELSQSVSMYYQEVIEMQEKLNTACSDEERAKKQLVKLQIALNESRVKIQKNRLPSVSAKYEADLYQGELMIKDIKVILDNSPLDVKRLNDDLAKAIDFIYSLYNNVNNLVGIAVLVEKTIVFGNRYRSSYPDIDSELTRADLCFRNGQYTKALKICIACIEKMHPGAYQKILAKNEAFRLENL